ncbi:alkyl sulfatase dimerization domain-containing protein [Streptomyces wuyuanensis]|uniref:alkyl sulfatase dimerization domain-containing protein n=1 Tax=Streptomyces wuyuanensis TaxID=1196353 RepID=UPI003426F8B5
MARPPGPTPLPGGGGSADASAEYLAFADRVWRGEESLRRHYAGEFTTGRLVAVGERTGFFPAFSNVVVFDTGDGLVLVDSGGAATAGALHSAVRAFSGAPVRYVVFTHGHTDHVGGVGPFDREAPGPEVVAQEAVVARFDRYRLTAGYNEHANRRQFGLPALTWPEEYRRPDITYRDAFTLPCGELNFDLLHVRGETDDHTRVWVPELLTLCPGDLFIWAVPNAGNPQKAQRHPEEWAAALRDMGSLGAEVMLPGHGVPVRGAGRIRQALGDTAGLLETLCEQTRDLMNRGLRLDEVLHRVEVPRALLERPYLRPTYDECEFVVRNLWRLWGGWYDQNPARLKPAPDAAVAAEFAAAAGGADVLARRALGLLDAGELRLACHLAEAAALAAPEDRDIARVRARVYARRAGRETSTMARGIFSWAAAESASAAEGTDVATELARLNEAEAGDG